MARGPRPTLGRRLLAGFGMAALAVAAAPASAAASPLDPTGVIKVLKRHHLHLNASQSTNWFGYNQGAVEKRALFNSITAYWTVPAATQHASRQAASSATWIGIGGGCLETSCTVTDPTSLIQTGTEQDVDSSGHASYSAWWELVPVPSITISNMTIRPGDRMHASVSEVVAYSNLWKITLTDVTRSETFTTTVPYASSHATAEWIEETPLSIGTSGTGETSLPNLTETPFDNATVNGKPAGLSSPEQIVLSNGSQALGTPSAPDGERDGFGTCAWASSCPVPAS